MMLPSADISQNERCVAWNQNWRSSNPITINNREKKSTRTHEQMLDFKLSENLLAVNRNGCDNAKRNSKRQANIPFTQVLLCFEASHRIRLPISVDGWNRIHLISCCCAFCGGFVGDVEIFDSNIWTCAKINYCLPTSKMLHKIMNDEDL